MAGLKGKNVWRCPRSDFQLQEFDFSNEMVEVWQIVTAVKLEKMKGNLLMVWPRWNDFRVLLNRDSKIEHENLGPFKGVFKWGSEIIPAHFWLSVILLRSLSSLAKEAIASLMGVVFIAQRVKMMVILATTHWAGIEESWLPGFYDDVVVIFLKNNLAQAIMTKHIFLIEKCENGTFFMP